MEINELKQDLDFYKKRFENIQKEKEVLRKETQVMRQELTSMKEFVKKIVIPKKGVDRRSSEHGVDKNDMLEILDFQRKRIEDLEKENDEIKKKYEKLLFDKEKEEDRGKPASVILADKSLSVEAALDKANERILLLEAKLKDITSNYSKEVSSLRNKLVKSQASEVLSAQNRPNSGESGILLKKSGSLSSYIKRDSRLEPIRAEKGNVSGSASLLKRNGQSLASFNLNTEPSGGNLFNYNKRSLNR